VNDVDVTDEEARLKARLEQLLGGKVILLERQPRWRKAWYATVEVNGDTKAIYVRGDKQIDAEPFPGLDREAAILQILERNGVAVPHVYGMCDDPIGIVMDRVPGTRDVAEAADDAERECIAEQYIEILAKMHSLDLAEFQAAGIRLPDTPVGVALAFVDANEVLYRRTKHGPEPLVEFVLSWARRNVPATANQPRFIHADTGQFLFVDGVVTCAYDFEASHIGDPLSDLAGLRTRNGTEPLGAEIEHLIRHYQKVTGQDIDLSALSFYTVTFMLTAVMSLGGPLANLRAEDMQAEYLTWDLMTRRAMLWAMAEVMDVELAPAPAVSPPSGYYSRVTRVLEGTIARMVPSSPADEANQKAAIALAQWAGALVGIGAANAVVDLDRAAAILGYRPADQQAADEALEKFVANAGAEHDLALLQYFSAQTEQRVAEAISIQDRLDPYALPKIVV
jgi:aminoglycoside phosphotransferase (APT) family kinase protein